MEPQNYITNRPTQTATKRDGLQLLQHKPTTPCNISWWIYRRYEDNTSQDWKKFRTKNL